MTEHHAPTTPVDKQAATAAAFVEIVNALVEDFDVTDVLIGVVRRSVQLLDAAAAGILLADKSGKLGVAAASGDNVELLEVFQVQNDEGPCVDCYTTGTPIIHGDLNHDAPWPKFATLSTNAGYQSVCAVPMRLKNTIIGCLNLFKNQPGEFSAPDITLARAIADVATIAIIQDQATRDASLREDALQHALNSRVIIEQAKGMIADRANIDIPTAFHRLRTYARNGGHRLSETAEAVVTGELDISAVTNTHRRPPPPNITATPA